MRISQAGNKIRPKQSAGFSLVEVLVVLVIIGLMASVVVMNLPPTKPVILKDVDAMLRHFNQSARASVMTNTPFGVILLPDGYAVVQYKDGAWRSVQKHSYSQTPPPKINLRVNGQVVDLGKARALDIPVIRFSPTGIATEYDLELQTNKTELHIRGNFNGQSAIVQTGNTNDNA